MCWRKGVGKGLYRWFAENGIHGLHRIPHGIPRCPGDERKVPVFSLLVTQRKGSGKIPFRIRNYCFHPFESTLDGSQKITIQISIGMFQIWAPKCMNCLWKRLRSISADKCTPCLHGYENSMCPDNLDVITSWVEAFRAIHNQAGFLHSPCAGTQLNECPLH